MIELDSNLKISIGGPEGDGHLLIMVVNGTACDLHRISLAQARDLSLALIKQVYRVEMINELDHKRLAAPVQAFSFQHRQQFVEKRENTKNYRHAAPDSPTPG